MDGPAAGKLAQHHEPDGHGQRRVLPLGCTEQQQREPRRYRQRDGANIDRLRGRHGRHVQQRQPSVSGYEASTQSGCPYHCYTVYESENIYVTVGGVTVAAGASKYGNSTSSAVAQALANAINGAGAGMPVSASVSGSTVALTSKLHGGGTDYSISVSYSWSSPFTTPDFHVSASGMSGGS